MTLTTLITWTRNRRTATTFFIILLFTFTLFSWIKQSPIFLDGDPFYHAKMAQLMIEHHGIIKEFPWMPGSILDTHFYDHHFLYHVLLVPFILIIGDPLIAIRLAMIFFAALFFACFYLLLKKLCVAFPLLFTTLLLISSTFVMRLSLDKAPAVSLLVLLAGLYACIARRPILLFCISFAYVWLYDAWPILLVVSFLWCLSNAIESAIQEYGGSIKDFLFQILKQFFTKKHSLLFVACFLGLLAGVILNPYFPNNVFFFKIHLISIALVTKGLTFGIGQEWFPVDIIPLMRSNLLFFTVWICALSWTIIQLCAALRAMSLPFEARTPSSTQAPSLFFGIFSVILYVYTLKAQRMAEYFIPMGTIFIALSLHDVFIALSFRHIKELLLFINSKQYLLAKTAMSIIILMSVGYIFDGSATIYESFRSSTEHSSRYAFHSMQRLGVYMKSHVPSGAIIATDNWSYFSQLFYYDDSHRYLWGLDPTYTHDIDPKKYDSLFSIMQGKNNDTAATTLKKDFNASYLVGEKRDDAQSKPLATYVAKDARFKKIYDDSEVILYAIR